MDEVDGMSGNQDRGGMKELLQIIKASKVLPFAKTHPQVPVICIANDTGPKLRPLLGVSLELKFQRLATLLNYIKERQL